MNLSTGFEDRKARIDVVPLFDCVFLLLVFFIYAMLSMSLHRGLKVDLPSGVAPPEKAQKVIITVSRDNALQVNGIPASTVSEAVEATRRIITVKSQPVMVSGDRSADLGVAVELLSGLRQANVKTVSFQVRETK